MEDLHDRGVWLTLNAASLAGAYGPETYHAARQVLERGWCRFLCSDAHGLRHIEALEAVDRSPMVQDWVNGEAAALQRGLLQAGD
jgi:tyrosine-protein phosphatase YwqE